MKALLHANTPSSLGETLGVIPWALVPVGNRPLIEYWIELCVDLGIDEIQILLGDGGEKIEAYAGEGERWGVSITYAFEKECHSTTGFLARNPDKWADGLLQIRGVCFPARGERFEAEKLSTVPAACNRCEGGLLFLGADGDAIRRYISGAEQSLAAPDQLALETIDSISDYYALNMRLVGGESARYVAPGYEVTADGCLIGYNTIMPAAAEFTAPVMIGNDTRIQPLTDIGPNAVVGNHVVIDSRTELSDCVIVDNTYIGHSLEIKGKIVSANRLIDAETGTCVELDDPWLLDAIKPSVRIGDVLRSAVGWLISLLMALLQLLPYLLLRPFLPKATTRAERRIVCGRDARPVMMLTFEAVESGSRRLRFFRWLSLDLFPRFLLVLEGRLWLCGQPPVECKEWEERRKDVPEYLPGAVTYADSQPFHVCTPETELIDANYYLHVRCLAEDLRIFGRAVMYRLTRQA